MTCEHIAAELVAFHLGALDLVAREAVEAHLLGCRSCLGRYLGVKRALEDAPLQQAAPSPQVRDRIRRDVAALVLPAAPKVIPLRPAWVLGAMAAAAALVLVAFELGAGRLRLPSRPALHDDPTLIDTAQADTSLRVL